MEFTVKMHESELKEFLKFKEKKTLSNSELKECKRGLIKLAQSVLDCQQGETGRFIEEYFDEKKFLETLKLAVSIFPISITN